MHAGVVSLYKKITFGTKCIYYANMIFVWKLHNRYAVQVVVTLLKYLSLKKQVNVKEND